MKFIALKEIAAQGVSHNRVIKKKVMLSSGDLPHLTNFSQAKFPPGEKAIAHFHQDMWEVFFVESGEGTIEINGQKYPLTPGNCFAVEPGEVHELSNNGAQDLVITYFGLES